MKRLGVALWGLTYTTLVFGVLPLGAAQLNESLGWPRWQSGVGRVLGVALTAAGVAISAHCSRAFARDGHGTPVPLQPPTQLVVSGLYRYSRNPIYVAQVAVVAGYALYFGHAALFAYALGLAALIQLAVVRFEEPRLHERFGQAYGAYLRDVPRWIGPTSLRTGSTPRGPDR